MKKFLIAGLALVAMFCIAELYYRSQNQSPKTPVATSRHETIRKEQKKEVKNTSQTVTLEVSGVKTTFAP